MVTYTDFGTYVADPWEKIEQNERYWYDPMIRDIYQRTAVYSPHTNFQIDLRGPAAKQIFFNEVIAPRPNIAPIDPRQMNSTRLYSDSLQYSVWTQRYGNGFGFHRESDMWNYWQRNGAMAGMMWLIQTYMGQVIVDHLDTLARNAFFKHPYAKFGLSSATGFGGITNTDKMDSDLIDSVTLYARDAQRPFSPVAQNMFSPTGAEIFCITTAGAVHDLKRTTDVAKLGFVPIQQYANPKILVAGELGTWRGVRFVDSPFAKLWNMGTITHATDIVAPLKPGDGAPDPRTEKVEGVRMVGQPNAIHYVEVTDASGFAAGQMVTISSLNVHDSTTLAAYAGKGVIGGPKFDDPFLQNVEVHRVDTTTTPHRVILKEPYMMSGDDGKGLETASSGKYGRITLGAPIHTALFLMPGATRPPLVCGVGQLPRTYTPKPFDDYESMFRASYDFYMEYQMWEPRSYEMVFLRGANALLGQPIFW